MAIAQSICPLPLLGGALSHILISVSRCPSLCIVPSILTSSSPSHLLDVRDAHDAHVLLEAVRQNLLPIIKRRLLSSEREELRSGHVYVWEEAQDEGGLLRWTDGRRWCVSFLNLLDVLSYLLALKVAKSDEG